MGILAIFFFAASALVALFYGVILIIKAFKTSILWGVAYLLIPFAALVFIIMHWDDTKKPFLKSLISLPLCLIGLAMAPNLVMSNGQGISTGVYEDVTLSTENDSYRSDSDTNLVSASSEVLLETSEPLDVIKTPTWVPASPDDLPTYLGKRIKINTTQGTERIGVLTEVNDIGLLITTDEGSQSIIPPRQIKIFHVDSS